MASGRPIVIEFAANVRDWLKGTRDVERSLDDVADSIDDATRDADRFEDRFGDAMKEAERDADKAARNMSRDFSKLEGDFGKIGKEASGELTQNLSQGLSSGNIEDVVQDTLGGLVSGLKGATGGVVAALAGIGALAFQQMRENAEIEMAALQTLGDATLDYMLGIGSAILTQRDAAVVLNEAVKENPEYWGKVKKAAEEAGLDWVEASTKIIAGGSEATEVFDELRDIMSDDVIYTSAKDGTTALGEQGEAAGALIDLFQDQQGEAKKTAIEFELLADAARPLVDITDQMRRNLQGAKDASRGLRGELPYYGGNRPT